MPWVDLYSKDDYASIYYMTSTLGHNVGGFDPAKPSIMMLHPFLLDSTWLSNQFGDPRLYSKYNLIAFDSRSSGQTISHPTPRRDSWVDAADIALCHQILQLPPCHILAFEATSINCALRLALLFPEICLSLTLCNVPVPGDLRFGYNGLDKSMEDWCWAEDLECLESAVTDVISILFGAHCDPDLKDEIAASWFRKLPPSRRPWLVETAGLLINGATLTKEMCSQITQPILIIHGEMNEACPIRDAETVQSLFSSAKNGAILYPVKGAGLHLSIVPSSGSILNQVFVKFVSRLPPSQSDIVPPQIPIEQRMAVALNFQNQLVEKETSGPQDPMSPLSFSCLPRTTVERQTKVMAEAWKGRLLAFDPRVHGRPIRKLSKSRQEHWFTEEKDRNSKRIGSGRIESFELPSRVERVEENIVNPSKLIKPNLLSALVVDKNHIKSSMVKVVRETTTTTSPLSKAFH